MIGVFLHRTLVGKVTGVKVIASESEGHYAQIILTLGISLFLQNAGLIAFGSLPISVQTPLSRESWEIGPVFLNQALPLVGSLFGVEVSIAMISHAEFMIFGALIVWFLIAEPHGLAKLWSIGKQKLRLWPFPH